MTKDEMMRNLDIVMKWHLNHAIWAQEEGLMNIVRRELEVCYGVLFSASILELITEEEFDNINKTLAYTSIKW